MPQRLDGEVLCPGCNLRTKQAFDRPEMLSSSKLTWECSHCGCHNFTRVSRYAKDQGINLNNYSVVSKVIWASPACIELRRQDDAARIDALAAKEMTSIAEIVKREANEGAPDNLEQDYVPESKMPEKDWRLQ